MGLIPANYAAPVRQVKDSEDVAIKPVDTAQGMSGDRPDLTKKEVARKPLETALCVSSNKPDLTQKEVAIKPVHTAQPVQEEKVVIKPVDTAQQPIKCCQQVRQGECHEQVVGQTKVAIQAAPLLQKTVPSEQDQDPIDSQVSTEKVQLRMGYNNILLSPLSLMDVQQASKSMEVVTKPVDTAQSLPQPPLQEQGRQDLTAIEDQQLPPHVRGPHDGAESPPPPETQTAKSSLLSSNSSSREIAMPMGMLRCQGKYSVTP